MIVTLVAYATILSCSHHAVCLPLPQNTFVTTWNSAFNLTACCPRAIKEKNHPKIQWCVHIAISDISKHCYYFYWLHR